MRSQFTFGGRSTKDFHMNIEKFPMQSAPVRRRKTYVVAGRNGALHESEDAFDNYIQPYQCYFHGSCPAPQQAHAIKAWLMGSGGAYQRLQDSYDPEHYRLATFAGPLDIENILNRYGRFTVNFDCAPQAFLVSGDNICTYTGNGVIYNPTQFNAKPLITVYGTGSGSVTVGSSTVRIDYIADQLILDCEMENAYRRMGEGAPERWNAYIYAIPFPELLPGENPVQFTGDITKMEIIPRWWEL